MTMTVAIAIAIALADVRSCIAALADSAATFEESLRSVACCSTSTPCTQKVAPFIAWSVREPNCSPASKPQSTE